MPRLWQGVFEMTPILKTLREVRKALELADKYIETYESWLDEAITSLNGLIAEIEKAEPFGWYHTTIQGEVKFTTKKPSWNETVWPPLYTHPAPAIPEGWQDIYVSRPTTGQRIIGCTAELDAWEEVWDDDEPIGSMKWWIAAPEPKP